LGFQGGASGCGAALEEYDDYEEEGSGSIETAEAFCDVFLHSCGRIAQGFLGVKGEGALIDGV
jgi:hypothetical protein